MLDVININDTNMAFEAWRKYMDAQLSFLFEAGVEEYQERGVSQQGDVVTVEGVKVVDRSDSIIANVTLRTRVF